MKLENLPHWQLPYNNYYWTVIFEDGKVRNFCHADTALDVFENFGTKLYVSTKKLKPTKALLAWK